MQITTIKELSKIIKEVRKKQGLTQSDLALASNVGIRFLSDLENGKPTCEIEKVFKILFNLGIKINVEIE